MKSKILVLVYVPLLESVFDIYIPVIKKVGVVKNLIIKIIEENTDGNFVNDGCKFLYDKVSGQKLIDDQFVKECGIQNGTKLILY